MKKRRTKTVAGFRNWVNTALCLLSHGLVFIFRFYKMKHTDVGNEFCNYPHISFGLKIWQKLFGDSAYLLKLSRIDQTNKSYLIIAIALLQHIA